jgi:hypothetical protein
MIGRLTLFCSLCRRSANLIGYFAHSGAVLIEFRVGFHDFNETEAVFEAENAHSQAFSKLFTVFHSFFASQQTA